MPGKENTITKNTFCFKDVFKKITEKTSPLAPTGDNMFDIILALVPAAIWGVVVFGFNAALILLVTTVTALILEFLWNFIFKNPQTIALLSAGAIGLMLGMCLPSTLPFWMAILVTVLAFGFKHLFVSFNTYPTNFIVLPRVILSIAFPAAMTKFIVPFTPDAVAAATPLASVYGEATAPSIKMAFFGIHSGSIGETSVFFLLIGAAYLIIRRIINPTVPLCFIGSVALLSLISGQNALLAIFSGGLVFAAFFIATDVYTQPQTLLGKIIFGLSLGVVTFIIRFFDILPEGIGCAIIIVTLINFGIKMLVKYKVCDFIKTKIKQFTQSKFYNTLIKKFCCFKGITTKFCKNAIEKLKSFLVIIKEFFMSITKKIMEIIRNIKHK